MKRLLARLIQLGLRRLAAKALALTPRGAVAHDVLVLGKVSIQKLRFEWRARDVHPWDRDLSLQRQAERFCQQALEDTESALVRLFQTLPDADQIDFRVLGPSESNQVIAEGSVEREEFLAARNSPSIRMRMLMMGVRFTLPAGYLKPVAA